MTHLILRLKELNQKQLEQVYHNVFTTDEGQLVLEDLKGRFWEYVPPTNKMAMGQQSVLIHIKNMLNPMPEEKPSGPDTDQGHSAQ